MMKKNEKGFALVLSLVLMLAMSLMGGALIVISASDHRSNNSSDEYQQTFYVAEAALLEGERYVIDQFLGAWDTGTHKRSSNRGLPANGTSAWNGTMHTINYNRSEFDSKKICFQSFSQLDQKNTKIVASESWNFGKLLKDNFHATSEEKADAKKLENYYYEYFIVRVGAAPYRGFGSSVKKAATDGGNDGMAYRIHGCGLKDTGDEDTTFLVALESVLVLPK